jgi:hypothetical protein
MGGMGQQRLVLSEIGKDSHDQTDETAQTTVCLPGRAAGTWQQQPLLTATERSRGGALGPSDRIRQAGLKGVAQARAALADAARRAETRTAA